MRIIVLVCLAAIVPSAIAATTNGITVERVAQVVADQHNANSSLFLDEVTVASSAKAVGRNVRITNTLKLKPNSPKEKLSELDQAARAETIPRACRVNENNQAFKLGLFYTFVYVDISGQMVSSFDVSESICKRLGK